jgi:hypothetical protein
MPAVQRSAAMGTGHACITVAGCCDRLSLSLPMPPPSSSHNMLAVGGRGEFEQVRSRRLSFTVLDAGSNCFTFR